MVLCEGNKLVTGGLPSQRVSNVEIFSIHNSLKSAILAEVHVENEAI